MKARVKLEVGFSSEEQITVTEAFGTTNSSFVTSTDELFDTSVMKDKVPKQFIYASSASDKTTYYWELYKNFAKRMFIGDRRYFLIDINVEVPLAPTMDGKPYPPLLDRSLPEKMMKTNPSKAMREYYNIFDSDSGDEQITKSATIARNETFYLPELSPDGKSKYIFSVDPAYRHDNSIMTIAKLCHDKNTGYYIEIVNMFNFHDYANELKMGMQMLPPEQIELIREFIKTYNGNHPQYEKIDSILVDTGAGGSGGSQYLPTMLYDWTAKDGQQMRGFIDPEYHEEKLNDFPNASKIAVGISPQKWRNTMVTEYIDMMDLGLIKFPKSYNNSGTIQYEAEDGELITKRLTLEEEIALANIDIAKEECKMIHKTTDLKSRKVSYQLRKDMQHKMHDDRWYTLIMLAHRLSEIRRAEEDGKYRSTKDGGYDYVFS